MKDKNLIIRHAINSDVGLILEIQNSNYLAGWNERDYLAAITDRDLIILTAVLNKKIVGFILPPTAAGDIAISPAAVGGKIQKSLINVDSEAEIYNFAVDKNTQRQGIGRRLLAELEAVVKENIWLEVRNFNKKAVDFYKKNGFQEIYRRKNYYPVPIEDALVLNLRL